MLYVTYPIRTSPSPTPSLSYQFTYIFTYSPYPHYWFCSVLQLKAINLRKWNNYIFTKYPNRPICQHLLLYPTLPIFQQTRLIYYYVTANFFFIFFRSSSFFIFFEVVFIFCHFVWGRLHFFLFFFVEVVFHFFLRSSF